MNKNIKILIAGFFCFLTACEFYNAGKSSLNNSKVTDNIVQDWQIQFTGDIDFTVDADLYELDLFETNAEQINELIRNQKLVVCYVNAGAWENWRPDSSQYPDEILGNNYLGWTGERWLDIRQIDSLFPILRERIALCKQKGFSGVEFDNVDGYLNNTGFAISSNDQLIFNIWLAETAHQYGLQAGLKNDPDQIYLLEPYFDFAIAESCFTQGWCDALKPFTNAEKPVFTIEYINSQNKKVLYCGEAQEQEISLIFKNINLDRYRETCPELLFGK